MARFGGYRGIRNYSTLTAGSSNNESKWFGIALGIIAALILLYAFFVEGRIWIANRVKQAKLKAKRKLEAIKELEMQANLFVKQHMHEDDATTNASENQSALNISQDSDDVDWIHQNRTTELNNKTADKMMGEDEFLTDNDKSTAMPSI